MSAPAFVEEPWRRLSIRVVYLDLIRVAISLATGYLGTVISDDPVWPLIAGSGAGLLGALVDLIRWRTTRFRITSRRVEMRSGWLARKHRIVARDRIRSVDSSARLLPRLFGLRTVHIGSGESESSFRLDGLDHQHAARLQQELMPGQAPRTTAESEAPESATPESEAGDAEQVIARLRREWVPLNVFTVWTVFAAVSPLVGLHWLLRPVGVDLFGIGRGLLGWESRGLAWNVVLVLVIAYPIGVLVTTGTFLIGYWNFELVRKGTPNLSKYGTPAAQCRIGPLAPGRG